MGCQTALKPTASGGGIGVTAAGVAFHAVLSGGASALPITRIGPPRASGGGEPRLEVPEPATAENGDLDAGAGSVLRWRMCKMTPLAPLPDVGDAGSLRHGRAAELGRSR
jgi:hypothetical protein